MYEYDQRPDTQFTDSAKQFIIDVKKASFTVLCGRNNGGKSYLLKTLAKEIGEKASYLGPARYQNFNLLGHYTPNRNKRRRQQRYREFLNLWRNEHQNIDNSPLNLQQAIAGLTDEKRDQLIEIMENLLGSKMKIQFTVPRNSMSQKYISVDGHNISYTSSGYRLIATLVTSLLDDEFDTYLIDEPELGISPEAQGILSDFIFNDEIRRKYFSHIKTFVLATHSTIFLDRRNISNNYFVEKVDDAINLRQVETIADISRIHFFLLGNRMETVYMPSAIIIVEGKCDHKFMERVVSTRFCMANISLIQANGDARIKEVFNLTRNLFGDIQKSPYRDRIFVVLDEKHSISLPNELQKMGLPPQNIIIWSKNGIEYYYPQDIVSSIFGMDGEITIEGDRIKLNGLEYTKNDLVDLVIPKIDRNTVYGNEFTSKFLSKVEEILACPAP